MIAQKAALTSTFHPERCGKRLKTARISPPLWEWKNPTLNKLKLYLDYIIKKAEIAPIR